MADPTPVDRTRIQPVPPIPIPAREHPAAHLPVPLTSFVGREREVTAVGEVLRRPGVRLVTLTGPGGVGKTRLAIRVAAEIADAFPDGVWFVALAPVRDPALVAATVAQTLGLRESGSRSAEARMREFLRDRRALLVLDNLEHLLEAGPMLAALLTDCPDLAVLATSRAVLRVNGEHRVDVPPLSLPSSAVAPGGDEAPLSEAVQLFVARATAARSDFTLTEVDAPAVATICARLDGLPLAIELAAARVRALPPAALLRRLDHRLALLTGGGRDQPARLRSMRDAIAWSHDLLTPAEQALFRCLAVFVGGFTLEAAEAVAETVSDVFDGVAALVDHSLVRQEAGSDGDPRYLMLETVREYALEGLAASAAEDAARDAHGAYFLALVEQAEAHLWGHDQLVWLARLETEHDNLRATLAWNRDQPGGMERVARLALSLSWFWYVRGRMAEGARWLEGLLAAASSAAVALSAPARARLLVGAGFLAYGRGELAGAAAMLEEGLALSRAAEDFPAHVRAAAFLGFTARDRGDLDRAAALFAEGLAAARASGDRWGIGYSTYLLSTVANELGDLEEQARLAEESLPLLRASGERLGIAYALAAVGTVAVTRRDGDRARIAFDECLTASRALGNLRGIGFALLGLAAVARLRGDHAMAAAHVRECLPVWRRLGNDWGTALALEELAAVAAACGDGIRAARLASAAAALRDATGAPLLPRSRTVQEAALAPARAALGEAAFAAAWAAGRDLPLDEVLAEALAWVAADPAMPPEPVAPATQGRLTPREIEVLRLIADGRSDREIAAALALSYRTVTNHVTSILTKLDAPSRAAAAAQAVRRGLA